MLNTSKPYERNKMLYAILIFITIFLGFASRKYSYMLPHIIGEYAGDILWTMMIFLIAGFIFSKHSTARTAIYAIGLSYAVEFSQLYHAPWLDYIRHTIIGRLLLGWGFLWSDLACYLIGAAMGMALELLLSSCNRVLRKLD